VSDEHTFLLQRVQPAMVGLIDGSLSTLAPIFAVVLASHDTRYAFIAGLATSLGAAWVGDVRDPMPRRTEGTILFAPVGDLVPVALRNLARGGTLALAGIYMTPIPRLDYVTDLFYERGIRSVTANTRADGTAFLAEASRARVRLATTEFPLEVANQALELLKEGAITGSGVLLTDDGFRV